MKLSQITETLIVLNAVLGDNPEISAITYDSRQVTSGTLFVAIKGYAADGHDYIEQACEKGAVAILSERKPAGDVAWVQVENVRLAMAKACQSLWSISFDDIFSVAITGTNGKTTIATIFNDVLAKLYGQKYCWQTGTAGNRLGEDWGEAARTTPEAVDLFRWLGEASLFPKALVMEASSHALVLERLQGIFFDVAIFTNLTQEHLDFHADMDDYYEAKKLLFTDHLKTGGCAVVNSDDMYGGRLAHALYGKGVVTYGKNSQADFRVSDIHCDWEGTFFRAHYKGKVYKVRTTLPGHFNVANISAVIASCLAKGIALEEALEVVQTLTPVRGRMERIDIDAPFAVVVDYAHTPDALKNILYTARKLTKGRVVTVFGAGGDRDRSKRAPMAEVVAKSCDYAIITSDNPRSENPLEIIADIEMGMPLDFTYEVEENRAMAIEKAMAIALPGDAVIVAGKGHETYQEIKGIKHHFDDAEEIVKAWKERKE